MTFQITTLEADNQHLEEVRIGLESSENKIKCRLRVSGKSRAGNFKIDLKFYVPSMCCECY